MDDSKLTNLSHVFKRIFSMPINKLTFRELQSAVLTAAEGDRDVSKNFLESLLTSSQDNQEVSAKGPVFKDFVKEFGVLTWLAKDVFEKGEFINFISSDIHNQPNRVFFSHSLRRVDGKEFEFLTDPASTFQLVQHFLNRVHELGKTEGRLLGSFRKEINLMKSTIDKILED